MAITFEYAVKYNGKYYPPNTPIKESVQKAEKAEPAQKAAKSRKKGDD